MRSQYSIVIKNKRLKREGEDTREDTRISYVKMRNAKPSTDVHSGPKGGHRACKNIRVLCTLQQDSKIAILPYFHHF